MAIQFDRKRWQQIKTVYKAWWDGTLERPIVPVELVDEQYGQCQFHSPVLSQANCADFSISPEQIIENLDADLSRRLYLGDSFPYVNLDCFGPGVVAAFVGARLDNSTGRVWFHPVKDVPVDELHFEYDPENIWLNRIKSICRAANKKWNGLVMVGMPDLGGVLDILSVFRPGEKLLLDLYDKPDDVKRLVAEIHELWFRFSDDIIGILQPVNPGYSDWSGLYSEVPFYILQSDFSYMISTAMFMEFALPQLKKATARLHRSFYHLDGIGQMGHLNALLDIDTLNGVQWVPGDGQPDCSHWPEVYQKIHRRNKRIQLIGGFDVLDAVAGQLGTHRGLQTRVIRGTYNQAGEMEQKLKGYGITPV